MINPGTRTKLAAAFVLGLSGCIEAENPPASPAPQAAANRSSGDEQTRASVDPFNRPVPHAPGVSYSDPEAERTIRRMNCKQLEDVAEEGNRIAVLASSLSDPSQQDLARPAVLTFRVAMGESVLKGCKSNIPNSTSFDFVSPGDLGHDVSLFSDAYIKGALAAYEAFQDNVPLASSAFGSSETSVTRQGGGQCRPSNANSQALRLSASTTCSSAESKLREWSNRGGAACKIFWGLVAQYSCQERYISTMGSAEYWNVTCQLPTSAEAMATTDFPFTSSCR